LVSIGLVLSEEKIFEKVYDVQRRRTPSDGNSSPDPKWAYTKCMFNVYKNQQSWQTGSRNLMGPKTLPTIWDTYMKLVTKYQISAINSG
jgi:hypothetical protein